VVKFSRSSFFRCVLVVWDFLLFPAFFKVSPHRSIYSFARGRGGFCLRGSSKKDKIIVRNCGWGCAKGEAELGSCVCFALLVFFYQSLPFFPCIFLLAFFFPLSLFLCSFLSFGISLSDERRKYVFLVVSREIREVPRDMEGEERKGVEKRAEF